MALQYSRDHVHIEAYYPFTMPKPRNHKPPRPREPPKDPNESVTIGGVTATRAQHKAVATMRRNHKKRARKNAKRQQSCTLPHYLA